MNYVPDYCRHPCASRTPIMALSTSFQVCCHLHHAVREHATVPADVADGVRGLTSSVAQPIAGDMHNIEFAIRIINETVPPGLVMGAHAFHRRIILSDVEIVGPRAAAHR
jgi:hypothetical protein